MQAELSFGMAAEDFVGETPGSRKAGAAGFAGDVQWFGRADRTEGRRGANRDRERTRQPPILGSAHGPRLLELLCMAG